MTVRDMLHEREKQILAPWAVRSAESRGRREPDDPDPLRTDFQRDRDRIIHCRAFRRLAHKTQVFILPTQDHVRTRLTHTLEVAQIAKTIARALCLNEDLTEAIALGHDLGHTPFGHAGEETLNTAVKARHPGMHFQHWEQSLRVVDTLEKDGRGLNLTWEVREGILGHTKGRADLPASSSAQTSLEAQAVKLSDRIAYVNHDMEDAVRARVLAAGEAPKHLLDVLGHSHSQRIGAVVSDIVAQSQGKPELRMSSGILDALNELKDFLFNSVYIPNSSGEASRVHTVVTGLFNYYCDRAGEDPGADERSRDLEKSGEFEETPCRRACDYVAGMTDRFAVKRYMDLFVPESIRFEEN